MGRFTVQNMTVKTGQQEQESWGQECWDRLAEIGQLIQDNLSGQPIGVSLGRTDGALGASSISPISA